MRVRKIIRVIATWVLVGCIAAIVVSVVGEWFIHVAEDKGWYQNAGRSWDRAMSVIFAMFSSWPFWIFTALVGGVTAGLWIDSYFAKREKNKAVAEAIEQARAEVALEIGNAKLAKVNRLELAVEAEKLAHQVAELASEQKAAETVAWEEDMNERHFQPAGSPRLPRTRSVNARADAQMKFGAKGYEAKFWSIIARAEKCIQLHYHDLWHLSHGADSRDFVGITKILMKTSADLRYDEKDIIMVDDPRQHIQRAITVQNQPQSPPDTEPETQP
jgi:hypothetical protein